MLSIVSSLRTAAVADELTALRDENARLRARVAALEAERGAPAALAGAIAQRATASVHEDRSNGARTLRTDAMLVRTDGGVRTRHWLTLRGQSSPEAPRAAVDLIIDAASSDGAYHTAPSLQLVIDGEPATFPVTSYSARGLGPSRGAGAGRRVDEKIVVALPFAILDRLAQAHAVTSQLGATTFRLTPEQLATAHAFRAQFGD